MGTVFYFYFIKKIVHNRLLIGDLSDNFTMLSKGDDVLGLLSLPVPLCFWEGCAE